MRRKEQRSMLMLAIIMAFVVGVFWAGPVGAKDENPCAALKRATERLGCETDAPVEKTGQTECYDTNGYSISCAGTGQDGDLQKGVAWPDPRFTDNDDDTVTDNLTGLMWAQNANADGIKTWEEALTYCNGLMLGEHTDWRLPNVKELQSLIDYGNLGPALPSGHPFTGVASHYWSSTTSAYFSDDAWYVYLSYGFVYYDSKGYSFYVWPVRGGE